jgi:hypothetical protein
MAGSTAMLWCVAQLRTSMAYAQVSAVIHNVCGLGLGLHNNGRILWNIVLVDDANLREERVDCRPRNLQEYGVRRSKGHRDKMSTRRQGKGQPWTEDGRNSYKKLWNV